MEGILYNGVDKFMNKPTFLISMWKRNKTYLIHLLDEFIKLFFTFLVLWLLMIILNFLFTEEPLLIKCMEVAAHFGILLIFLIDIASDIYYSIKTRMNEIKR